MYHLVEFKQTHHPQVSSARATEGLSILWNSVAKTTSTRPELVLRLWPDLNQKCTPKVSRARRRTTQVITRSFGRWPQTKIAFFKINKLLEPAKWSFKRYRSEVRVSYAYLYYSLLRIEHAIVKRGKCNELS